ncbi:MAG: response regulator transcription factor [Bacillota bacterium]
MVRILIADDYAPTREMLRLFLSEDPGFTIVGEAENGLRAVEMAEELRPDVVLMDVSMPVMNGMAATRLVLKANRRARVITLSGHAEQGVARNALDAGAYRHLTKPFDLFALSDLLKGLDGAPEPDSAPAAAPKPALHPGLVLDGSGEGRT